MGGSEIYDRYLSLAEEVRRHGGANARLMAVSKTHEWEKLELLRQRGVRLFGENRAQEAEEKFRDKDLSGLELHFIGHLQRNKVKKVLEYFGWVDSVDSLRLARAISDRAVQMQAPAQVLVEVNTSGEAQKQGILNKDELDELLEALPDLPGVVPRGLMTMGPLTDDRSRISESFRSLRRLYEEVGSSGKFASWDTLSMGMSGDFRLALAEGSTLVRIGTAIFGDRDA